MALTGLEIYKQLPKTNCKDCGFPTCLAFAMKLAAKQADLNDCPHVSEEAQQKLDDRALARTTRSDQRRRRTRPEAQPTIAGSHVSAPQVDHRLGANRIDQVQLRETERG